MRYEDVLALDHRVVNLLQEVRDSVSFHATSMSAATLFTGSPGRPRCLLPREQLEFLDERRFRNVWGTMIGTKSSEQQLIRLVILIAME